MSEPRIGDWMHTIRGPWWALDPRVDELHIEVIARGCATECRFNGQGGFYSVGQHAVHCSEIAPDPFKLWALLHDAPEGLGLKDLPRPVKRHIGDSYHAAESGIMLAVCDRWDLPYTRNERGWLVMPEPVHRADETLLVTEARDLIGDGDIPRWDHLEGITPLRRRIRPWTWQKAERRFLARFHELTA